MSLVICLFDMIGLANENNESYIFEWNYISTCWSVTAAPDILQEENVHKHKTTFEFMSKTTADRTNIRLRVQENYYSNFYVVFFFLTFSPLYIEFMNKTPHNLKVHFKKNRKNVFLQYIM